LNIKPAVLLAVAIVVATILLGHFYPPSGLLFMPVAMCATTGLICYSKAIARWGQVLLSYFFLAITDIGIKLYAGGIHDLEGEGFTSLLFLTGLLFATILVVAGLKPKKLIDMAFVALFVVLGCLHLLLFADLGLDPRYL
jgi:hypothetical protein